MTFVIWEKLNEYKRLFSLINWYENFITLDNFLLKNFFRKMDSFFPSVINIFQLESILWMWIFDIETYKPDLILKFNSQNLVWESVTYMKLYWENFWFQLIIWESGIRFFLQHYLQPTAFLFQKLKTYTSSYPKHISEANIFNLIK